MITGKANLIIDLGNSETRVITQHKYNGGTRQTLTHLPNRYALHESTDPLPDNYLDVDTESDRSYIFSSDETTYVVGRYSDFELPHEQFRPSSTEKKHKSVTTSLAIRMAFLAGFEAIARLRKVDVSDLEIEWNVIALIPPADIDNGHEALVEKIREVETLSFALPTVDQKVNINKVLVLSEGFCSFLGVLFTREGGIRESHAGLAASTTLVIDVGAGTTDFSLIRRGQAIDSMKDSVTIGGNNVLQHIRKELRREGLTFNENEIQEAIRVGTVKDGAKDLSIVDALMTAKRAVSQEIVSQIRDYLEGSPYPARSIESLLIVGGGTLNTVEGAEPLSKFIVEYFKRLSPNVELVSLPKEKVKVTTENDTEESVDTTVSPRILNVLGAAVVARQRF